MEIEESITSQNEMANTDLILGCDSEFAYLPLMNKNTFDFKQSRTK